MCAFVRVCVCVCRHVYMYGCPAWTNVLNCEDAGVYDDCVSVCPVLAAVLSICAKLGQCLPAGCAFTFFHT